jgi:rare lipoprotein A
MSTRAAVSAARNWLTALLAVAGMCACAAPKHDSRREIDPAAYETLPYTQRPYNVFGVWYYPISSARGFVEEGRASWYGPGFHGKKTSNGESYDMHALTAAHKTLPLGTLVKVTRTDSGKSVVVRLNDRGPFVDGRIIDLSYSAAYALDMIGSGTAPVRIEAQPGSDASEQAGTLLMESVVEPDPRTDLYTVPVGLYSDRMQAEEVREQLGRKGHAVRILELATAEGTRYKVCAGVFQDLIEAQISAAHLREAGYAEACVIGLDGR